MCDKLAAMVPDGACIALAPDYSGCSLALVKALIARQARGLRLVGCPQLGLQAELLIAAGCVESIETAAIGLGEWGQAPAFARAYHEGHIDVRESTCPAIHSGLQAAEKGVPFMPVAGVLGSDLVKARADWRVIDNPMGAGDILLVPAIRPDFALMHVPLADREGALWIGVRRELMLMAHAASHTLATAEQVRDTALIGDPSLAAGTIPALYVDAVEHVPDGAWPNGLFGHYPADETWLRRYLAAAAEPASLADFLQHWVAA